MEITISGILSRSDQGRTLPFLCCGDDGAHYFVKGRYAGLRSLCCEWIAARLARELGLRSPNVEIVDVPRALVEASERSDALDLGVGPAFGSCFLDDLEELTARMVRAVPEEQQRWVLLFDWWVRNADRTLTEYGGNPNLFWSNSSGGLVVLDFNLAFDPEFDAMRFWETHAFRRAVRRWDAGFRELATSKLNAALSRLPDLWQELPTDWKHLEGDLSVPESLSRSEVESTLSRFQNDPALFWDTHP